MSAISRAVRGGERFIVTRRGKPVCALVPVPEARVEPGSGEAWDSFWRLVEEIGNTDVVDPRSSAEILAEERR